MIELRQITKVFREGPRAVPTLRGVDLRVEAGEFLAIMGPSGSGKSTLLHVMGGLEPPTSGSVWFQRRELTALSDRERSILRRTAIGFIFQRFNLVPSLTAAENVALPLMLGGMSRRESLARAEAGLARFGLAGRATHFPDELSGGEMQRTAIARALSTEPALVLCDEPTGSLDSASGAEVLEVLRSLPEPGKRSVVMVTHDPQAAGRCDRLVTIRDGAIEQIEVLRSTHACAAPHA
ncbi:MAG: ABC transporter ATP-binding protein [Isosphaeraceae bacterium]